MIQAVHAAKIEEVRYDHYKINIILSAKLFILKFHYVVSLCILEAFHSIRHGHRYASLSSYLIIIDLCYQVQQVGLMKKDHTKFPPETVFWQKTSPKESSYLTYIEISFQIKLRPWGPPGGLVKSLPTNLISLDVVLWRR